MLLVVQYNDGLLPDIILLTLCDYIACRVPRLFVAIWIRVGLSNGLSP